MAYTGSGTGHEDQASEIGSAFIAQRAGRIDESGDTIGLKCRSSKRRAPASSSGCSLLRLEKFFLGVCSLGAVVGVTEKRGQDGEGGSMGEDGAESDGGRLDRREV